MMQICVWTLKPNINISVLLCFTLTVSQDLQTFSICSHMRACMRACVLWHELIGTTALPGDGILMGHKHDVLRLQCPEGP